MQLCCTTRLQQLLLTGHWDWAHHVVEQLVDTESTSLAHSECSVREICDALNTYKVTVKYFTREIHCMNITNRKATSSDQSSALFEKMVGKKKQMTGYRYIKIKVHFIAKSFTR